MSQLSASFQSFGYERKREKNTGDFYVGFSSELTISCTKLDFTGEQGGRLALERQQKVVRRNYQAPTVEGHLER